LLATLGACSTVALLVVADIFLAVAAGLAGDERISMFDLFVFNTGGLVIVGWLGLLASSDKVDVMLARLARATTADRGDRGAPTDGARRSQGWLARALTNLWIPVTFMFLLAGWLVYATGGLVGSPFVSLPVTMTIIGQCVYEAPLIEYPRRPGVRALLVLFCRVLRFYAYPQLLFAAVMVTPGMLQIDGLIRAPAAPIAETMIATQLNLSIGMCVAYIARRFDRASTAPAHKPSSW
jgi:hypothetical protein